MDQPAIVLGTFAKPSMFPSCLSRLGGKEGAPIKPAENKVIKPITQTFKKGEKEAG